MYDLARFTLKDMTECCAALRTLGASASCLEEVAERVVQYLFTRLGDARTGKHGCALVRFFTTQPYGDLDGDTQQVVRDVLGRTPKSPSLKCLTLRATAGEDPDWNDTSRSRRYRALPLAGPEFVAQFPMFAQLFKQFGVRVQTDVDPDPALLVDGDESTYNVFYVPEAKGSPFVPVQEEFVVPFGIRSVLGFGGILPSGNLFVVVLFAKVHVPRQTADLFKTPALSVKLALLGLDDTSVLLKAAGRKVDGPAGKTWSQPELQWVHSEVETLEQLLKVHEQAVLTHADQQNRAEEALQESESRLASVMQATNDAVVWINHLGNIIFWSSGAQEMFGYSWEEILCGPATRIIPEGFHQVYHEAFQSAGAANALSLSASTFESVGLRKDGTRFPLEFSLTCCKMKSPPLFIGAIRDMTERKRAEEALQKSEHRFRSLVETARDVIVTLAKDGTITSLNPAFETNTHWAADDWIGRPFAPLLHPDDLLTATELFRYIIEKQIPLTCSVRIRTKDDGYLIGELAGTPQIEAGQVVGVLVTARDITERRAIEEVLRQSEEQLRSVVQSTNDAILTIDRNGYITFWNVGAAQMFGYSAMDMIGQPATVIIPERYREAHRRGVARAAAGRLTMDGTMFELVGLKKDGTEFPVEFSLASWKTRSGLFFTGVIRDITDRKRSETALRESEERLRVALDAVHMGIWDWNIITNTVTWSKNVSHIFGLSEDNAPLTYEAYLTLIHPDDQAMVAESIAECMDRGARLNVRHRILWPDRSLHWVGCKGDALRDDGGQAVRMLGTIMDVTERKLTEEVLQETRERFSAAFDYAAIGMALVATDGRFLQVNQSLCRILGYSEQELLATNFQTITHPEDLSLNLAHRHHMLTADTPTFHMEKRYFHNLGHIVWAQLSVALVRDPEGQPSYFVSQIQDITERKRGEEALRQGVERFEKQQAALVRLTHSKTVQSSDLDMKLRYTTELAAETLGVERVSIWRYADDRDTIRCVDLYELHPNRHSSGHELRVGSYPAYFKALAEHQLIAADDAHRDPRTSEFADGYLSPLGIGSMMDVPIYHFGRLEGVMCCEHVGGSRQWMQDEQMFAVALSNLVSLAYEQWERKQAESARRESDERFSTFMRHFPAVAFMKDASGRHLYINERLEQILQMARHDWYLKTNDELFPIPTSATFNEHDLAVLKSGQSRQFIETTSQADGIHHWLVTKFPICDERGLPFLLGGVGIDITERKRAEEALRRSERELADFFENGAVGLHWVGADGIILKANKRQLDLLGYLRDEYVGHHIAEFHVDEAAVRDILQRLSAGETLHSYEARLRCKDGTVRHVLLDSNAFGEDGNFVHSRCFTRDITEHKRAQELLRESEEFSQRVIASSRDCIKVLDLDGRLLWMNEGRQELMGICEFSEVQNSRWVEFWHGKDREAADQAFATALAGGAGSFQGYCPTVTGQPKWWDVIVTPIHNAQGEIHRLLSVSRDVTARKGAEEQLQNSLSQLRTLSARLEAVREEERARIARELHDELGVGLTCHKIDLSRLSTMIGDAIGPEHRRKADSKTGRRTVDGKIRSMMDQVDTTIAAVQRIVTELRPGILDDLGLVAALEWQTQEFQRRTGIACLFTPGEDDLQVDPERATVVFRICQEALTNVARHAAAAAVIIQLEERAGALMLEVQDNGCGIPEEEIFDLHSLGLLGMRERATLFGGSLEIKGCPDKGTTITLRLPNPQPI